MGFIWRMGTPTSEDREKQDGTNFTWRNYTEKLFGINTKRHQNSSQIILINNPYDIDNSIKCSEHENRAAFTKFLSGTKNIFIRLLEKFPSAQEF